MSTARPEMVAGPMAGSNRPRGILVRKRLSGSPASMPSTEFVVAAHADVGDEGRAARQHALVGGGRMGVRADHAARAPVDEIAHRLLLAGRLGVEVDQDGIGALA